MTDAVRGSGTDRRMPAGVRSALSALLPLRIVRDAWWLSIVAIAVLQQVHAGLDEHVELSPLLHLLRDGALAVPAAACAIVLASLAVAGRSVAHSPRRHPGPVDRVVWVVTAAVVFAILSVPGNQLHGVLFGAEDEAELSWLADVAFDAGIALIGAVLALAPLAAFAGLPIRDPDAPASQAFALHGTVLEPSARSNH
jgi:hypothetical protein